MRKTYSNQQVIDAITKGDNSSVLKQLYKGCFPKVKRYILTNSGTEGDAWDIFQDAVLVLCKQIRLNKFDSSFEVDGFIYTVGKNLWINKKKKDSKMTFTDEYINPHSNEQDFSDLIVTKEREKMIGALLSRLGEKCVELLQYSIYHKLSNKEICTKMVFASENAVKTQKYKCKQKLIEIMDEYPSVKELID